jgi:putative ABC transport system permease protein
MFIFFSNFVDIMLTTNQIVNQNINVDALFQKSQKPDSPYMTNELTDKLEKMDGISEVFKLNFYDGILPLSKKMLNEKFAYSLGETKNQQYEDWYFIKKTSLFSYDETALKLFNKQNKSKIDYDQFCKSNQAIIVNKSAGFDKNKKSFYDQFTKYKVGDKLELPLLNKSFVNKPTPEELQKLIKANDKIKLDVVKVVDLDAISGVACERGYEIIVSPDTYKRITSIDTYDTVAINYKSKEARDKLYEKLNVVADENKVSFYDVSKQRKQMNDIVNQLMILTYGFIGLIVLIAIVNIINTVTINLLVKKRE